MLPKEFCERMKEMLGTEYDAFLTSYEQDRVQSLRINPWKVGEGFARSCGFRLEQIPWAKNGYYYEAGDEPGKHIYHEAGVYYIQEASAMIPAACLEARPGEKVLDLCAAPGGKSTQIAADMQQKGLLVCNEIHLSRAKILSENIERLGIENAVVVNAAPQDLAGHFPEFFDRILVDAPCSGEGMFRKQPEAVKEWSVEQVQMCARRQDEIMEAAYGMLRPGGRMVYSTCTFAPEEDEGTISRFRYAHPDMSPVEMPPYPGMMPGRRDWCERFGLQDKEQTADGAESVQEGLERTQRIFPHRMQGEGHFVAILQKEGSQEADKRKQERRERTEKYSALPELRAFAEDVLTPEAEEKLAKGRFVLFGSQVYLLPEHAPDFQGLKVLRAGLHLGSIQKGRLEPSHAWAMALDRERVQRVCELKSDEDTAYRYVQGETFEVRQEYLIGFTEESEGRKRKNRDMSYRNYYLITVDGYSLGWGKCTKTTMKNHYPKGLRKSLRRS